ncbi:MAG: hypothetical protein M0031_10080 [Thermaerobacter sp.]|jgi:hypothetical protein|nr:hypothetical protein [Thermaerobacter sp.]
MTGDFDRLHAQRAQLYQELAKTGDFRRGSIHANYRRCGKPSCACSQPGHPGHGPQHLLTVSQNGKSVAKNLRPGSELELVEKQVANYHRFRELTQQIVEVNEKICDTKLKMSQAEAEASAKKGASKQTSSRKLKRNSPHS